MSRKKTYEELVADAEKVQENLKRIEAEMSKRRDEAVAPLSEGIKKDAVLTEALARMDAGAYRELTAYVVSEMKAYIGQGAGKAPEVETKKVRKSAKPAKTEVPKAVKPVQDDVPLEADGDDDGFIDPDRINWGASKDEAAKGDGDGMERRLRMF